MLLMAVVHSGTMPRVNQALIIRFDISFTTISYYNFITMHFANQPRVLMTEAELSIPPFKWTEYMNEKGKIYYSDGETSR
jgi:hypothetical protein